MAKDENSEEHQKLVEELAKKAKDERAKELETLSKGKVVTDKSRTAQLSEMLKDRSVAKQSEFTEKGKKTAGVSAGYIANESETGQTFILKHFYKSNDDCKQINDPQAQRQAKADRDDGVRELFGATMYQFLLYDRAPKEELVTPNKDHPRSLYIRSKFFKNAEQMSVFSGGTAGGQLKASSSKLKKVEGFEKVVAACHILGEFDYHSGNIMVQTQKDNKGKEHKVFTKIDHGRSLVEFNQDFGAMIDKTATDFKSFGYDQAIAKGNLQFNVQKYSESLQQMVSQFSESQIDAIVDQKVAELKKTGFDPSSMSATFLFGDDKKKQEHKPINNFEDLSSVYKDLLKRNLNNMKEISAQVEIVTKFSNVSPEFKKGGWLQAMADSPYKDPVAYAAHNNIQIEGKNALVWAYDNNYEIKVTMKTEKTIETQETKWKSANGKWTAEEVTVSKKQPEVKSYDPLMYIAVIKQKNSIPLSQSELEFASHAAEFNLKTSQGSRYKEILSALKIKPDQKITDKMYSDHQKVAEHKIVPLIDNFTKELTTGTKITEAKVEKLYNDVLNSLKQGKYLNDKEISDIKKDPDFKKNIKVTAELMNLDTPKLASYDKVNFKIANFCKKIGCSGIAGHFMKKITPENLTKIHNIEKGMAESIKINAALLKKHGVKEGVTTKKLESVQTKVEQVMKTRAARQINNRER